MKITVINGTEKHGVTWHLKEAFLAAFRSRAEITEFDLPGDCPGFCTGCTACFTEDERRCKDAASVQKIEKAMLEADLLVFTSPAYVFHATGAMKAMLDHFGYRWMPHRPAKEMFGKRAVIITQCLGAGSGSAAKDIKDSLSWWGVSHISVCTFRLMSDIHWDKLPGKKKKQMTSRIERLAGKISRMNFTKPARTGLPARCKFYAVRMMQTGLGKEHPEYADYRYWHAMGWLGTGRPWK